ncbi:MAG TPA: molybdopterin converting factor subunit 1 [Rhodothermales bacterium]
MTPTPQSASTATTQASVEVHVLLFSVLRERLGTSTLSVRVPEQATVADLLDAVCAEHPAITRFRKTLRVAVNAEYASADDPVRAGDEIALITPVSGG